MSKPELQLRDSEWTILRAVWKDEPCTAPAIQEMLVKEKGWAYTTVKTLMDRMVKKGLLRTEKIRNLYLYYSAITPTQAKKGEIRGILKRAFDGALTPMMQFLIENETLSQADFAQLEQMIQNRKKAAKSKKA